MRALLSSAREKLRRSGGETITEVLCAVLVAALSVSILATMLACASRMIRDASAADDALYSALTYAETGVSADAADTVTITVDGSLTASFDIQYCGDPDVLVSYKGGSAK